MRPPRSEKPRLKGNAPPGRDMLAVATLALTFSAPFCTDRSSCSSHGDCDCKNGVCQCDCDVGFSGAHCETAACNVTCHHGGSCNTAGTACDCPASSGWVGADCTTWDPSHLPNGTLANRLQNLKNSSANKLQSNIVKYGSKICQPGQECVGWGVDVTNGKMGSGVPMLDLNYDSSHSSWRNLVFPKGVTVNGFDAPDFDEPDTRAFLDIDELTAYKTELLGGNKGRGGAYARTLDDYNDNIFQAKEDVSLTITQAVYALYSMDLVPDGTSPSQYMLKLDEYTLSALQGLGPYEQDADLWREFFGYWGTSAVVSARGGGILEERDMPSTALQQTLERPSLESNGKCAARGFHPIGPTCTMDTIYKSYTSWQHPTGHGGTPVDGVSLTAKTMAAWQASVADTPILVDYTMTPLSPFISDEHVKSIYDEAVEKYVAEQKAAQPKMGCPPTCNGKGTCKSGATKCTCENPNPNHGGDVCWSGRACKTFEFSGTFKPQTWDYRATGGPAGTNKLIKALEYDQCTKQLVSKLPGGYYVWENPDTCTTGCQIRQDGSVCAWAKDAGPACVGPWVSTGASSGGSCHHTSITCSLTHSS